MKKSHILPTVIVTLIGIAGVLLLLFAWHLPPFAPAQPTTENAYIRGKVTSLAPQLSGYLTAVDVRDFQAVKVGDVIARIDDRVYRQRLNQAEAVLATARASLAVAEQTVHSAEAQKRAGEATVASAQSAFATARSESERTLALRERGIASAAVAEQADLNLQKARATLMAAGAQMDVLSEGINSAKAQVAARKADIANAEAAVELARLDLENTVIRAPVDGRLGQVTAHSGQYVSAGASLVSLVSDDLWLVANFTETGMNGLAVGKPVTFTVDALGGRRFTGSVESFSPATASEFSLLAGTNATGNFTKIAQRLPVRIKIAPGQPESDYLVPGLSVIVTVDTGNDND